jgi:bifunctional UDP-N-acetylglucosamine pyrophosphorylase/glucosamine-1-phosphate N-acetyltransferase
MNGLAVIVLAAGMGTRMKSASPKVMHKIGGRSLLGHVLTTATQLKPERTVVVIGPEMHDVAEEARRYVPGTVPVEQTERLGTGHAVSMAKQALNGFSGVVLVLYGDCPLVTSETLSLLIAAAQPPSAGAVLAFEAEVPHGYGRIIRQQDGSVIAIREELDASPQEKLIKVCNAGIIATRADVLWGALPQIRNTNAKREFYLTDLIEVGVAAGHRFALSVCSEAEVAGINDREQLAALEARFQSRRRTAAMLGGATLIDPHSVYFSADTIIGQDVTIEPNVFFGPGVAIGDNVHIAANSHLEGARVAPGCRIGPFARLRPGAEIGPSCHIGNFVEIKQASLSEGAKVNHLSYVGDASVGARSNVGAGTITCNYDGFDKHRTEIGADVFVGSNTALVAPVKVGNGANIAAGSVVTQDVPADALAIARGEQVNRDGWAKRYRDIKRARKAARGKG